MGSARIIHEVAGNCRAWYSGSLRKNYFRIKHHPIARRPSRHSSPLPFDNLRTGSTSPRQGSSAIASPVHAFHKVAGIRRACPTARSRKNDSRNNPSHCSSFLRSSDPVPLIKKAETLDPCLRRGDGNRVLRVLRVLIGSSYPHARATTTPESTTIPPLVGPAEAGVQCLCLSSLSVHKVAGNRRAWHFGSLRKKPLPNQPPSHHSSPLRRQGSSAFA